MTNYPSTKQPPHLLICARCGFGALRLARLASRWLDEGSSEIRSQASKIHEAAGFALPFGEPPAPFRAPHCSVTEAGLRGRFLGWKPAPGELSCAHGGTLFLDDLERWSHTSLMAIRLALELGCINLTSEGGEGFFTSIPARFRLIALCESFEAAPDWMREICEEISEEEILGRIEGLTS